MGPTSLSCRSTFVNLASRRCELQSVSIPECFMKGLGATFVLSSSSSLAYAESEVLLHECAGRADLVRTRGPLPGISFTCFFCLSK